MSATTDNRLRCTCSAFFETEEDLERHLDDNIEQLRLRDQWLQWLQTEARRYRPHAKITDTSQPDATESEHNNHGDGVTSANKSQSRTLTCPSCSRQTPFATKQKLRRHFEQHVTCHEVCVCCTKVFRLVREFRRHAENCSDKSKRKVAYMDATCEELRQFSDTQLDEALNKTMALSSPSKKRKWEKSVDSDNTNQPDHAIPDQGNVSLSVSPSIDGLFPIYDPNMSDAALHIDTGLKHNPFLAAPENVHPSLGAIESFDAPLMHIMNGVPLFINSAIEGCGHTSSDPAQYQLS